jgi:hypothetical protein
MAPELLEATDWDSSRDAIEYRPTPWDDGRLSRTAAGRRLALAASASDSGPQARAAALLQRLGTDYNEATFQRHTAFLADSHQHHPADLRADAIRQLQRDYGNQYVQRLAEQIMRERDGQGNDSLMVPLLVHGYIGPLTRIQRYEAGEHARFGETSGSLKGIISGKVFSYKLKSRRNS